MAVPSYKSFRFPPEIISHAIWLYFRFSLSFRDVEELLAQRGVVVTYETVRQWCLKFGQSTAHELRHRHRIVGTSGIWMRLCFPSVDKSTSSGEPLIKMVRCSTSSFRVAETKKRPSDFSESSSKDSNTFRVSSLLISSRAMVRPSVSFFLESSIGNTRD